MRTVEMAGKGMPAHRLTAVSSKELYWTFAQLVAHHTSGGCNLQPGDLLGTGTISGPSTGSLGSLLELTENGRRPMNLPSGETRTLLEDGDEIIIRGRAQRPGFASVGFGECVAKVLPSF